MEGLFKTSTGELFEKVSKKRVVVAADWACRGPHLEAVQRDPEGVYGDLLPHLRAADLAIVNVETTLSEKGAPILKGGPNISCPADCVKGLTQVPFHIACLANNHTRDFDDEGLIHTIEILQNAGLATCGAGSNPEEITAPLIWELGEIKLGILNVAEGEACLPSREGRPGVASLDLERIEKQLAQLKETADFTLVVVTLAGNMCRRRLLYPNCLQENGACRCKYGGCPPSPCAQGIEIYRGAPIVYSMGNFLFWMGRKPVSS